MDFSGGVLFLVEGDYYLRDLEEGAEGMLRAKKNPSPSSELSLDRLTQWSWAGV